MKPAVILMATAAPASLPGVARAGERYDNCTGFIDEGLRAVLEGNHVVAPP